MNGKPLIKILVPALLTVLAAGSLSSCFTGVESTPKITSREIKKKNIITTPEIELLQGIGPQKVSSWHRGKEFYVTDPRVSLIFSPSATAVETSKTDSLAGSIIRLESLSTATGITGQQEIIIAFTDSNGNNLLYRPGMALDTFKDLPQFAVPFTVEMFVVNAVDSILSGNTYYYLQARRNDVSGAETSGPRYQPVTITHVLPGVENLPLKVFFRDADGHEFFTYMTVGQSRTATRNFNTLFALKNPRTKYKDITDSTWKLIVNSTVKPGMTTQECRLALGSPSEHLRLPSTGGMVERWSYDNGVFLFFEDGHLTQFRQ